MTRTEGNDFFFASFLGPQKEGRAGPDQNQSITRGHES